MLCSGRDAQAHACCAPRGGGGAHACCAPGGGCTRVDGMCPRTRELVRARTSVGCGRVCTAGLSVRAHERAVLARWCVGSSHVHTSGCWGVHKHVRGTPLCRMHAVPASSCVAHTCRPQHGVFHRGPGGYGLQGDLEHKHQVRNRVGTPLICTNAAQVCVTQRVPGSQRHSGAWGGLQSCSFTCEGPAQAE